MSPLERHALAVASSALSARRLRALSPDDRRVVERLATTIALRVVETLESAAATDPNVAAALDELYSGTAFP